MQEVFESYYCAVLQLKVYFILWNVHLNWSESALVDSVYKKTFFRES